MKKLFTLFLAIGLAGTTLTHKHSKKKSKCCRAKRPEHAFRACLTFDQVLTGQPSNNPTHAVPVLSLPNGPGRPSTNGLPGADEVHGTFEICFDEGYTSADYKLTVKNINVNGRNDNENLLGAFLFYSDACSAPPPGDASATTAQQNEFNCRQLASLCGLGQPGNLQSLPEVRLATGQCGAAAADLPGNLSTEENTFICCGTLTNQDLLLPAAAPTVAALAELIRAGLVYISVNGSSGCDSGNAIVSKPYGLATNAVTLFNPSLQSVDTGSTNGLIRGQLFAAETV